MQAIVPSIAPSFDLGDLNSKRVYNYPFLLDEQPAFGVVQSESGPSDSELVGISVEWSYVYPDRTAPPLPHELNRRAPLVFKQELLPQLNMEVQWRFEEELVLAPIKGVQLLRSGGKMRSIQSVFATDYMAGGSNLTKVLSSQNLKALGAPIDKLPEVDAKRAAAARESMLDTPVSLNLTKVSAWEALQALVAAINKNSTVKRQLELRTDFGPETFATDRSLSVNATGLPARDVLCSIIAESPLRMAFVYLNTDEPMADGGTAPKALLTIQFFDKAAELKPNQ